MKQIIIFLMLLFSFSLFAQEKGKLINHKEVPDIVKRAFKRKAPKAKEVKWQRFDLLNQDEDEIEIYKVSYTEDGFPCEINFDEFQKIKEYRKGIDTENLKQQILTYIKKNHRKLEIKEAFYVEKGRKDKYYSIYLSEFVGKKKNKIEYITEIQFLTNGKYLSITEANIPEEEEAEEEIIDDLGTETGLDEKVEDQEVKKKELPSETTNYLKDEFDYLWSFPTIMIKNHNRYGTCYYIVAKKQGEKWWIDMYFDTNGKLLSRTDRDTE